MPSKFGNVRTIREMHDDAIAVLQHAKTLLDIHGWHNGQDSDYRGSPTKGFTAFGALLAAANDLMLPMHPPYTWLTNTIWEKHPEVIGGLTTWNSSGGRNRAEVQAMMDATANRLRAFPRV